MPSLRKQPRRQQERQRRADQEVVDPAAAERLAGTPDPRLAGLLPPALSSATGPEDPRRNLWFDVTTSVAMGGPARRDEHLRAFQAYSAAAQAGSLAKAHAADAPDVMREAIADWLYWKHLTGLLEAATAPAS